MTNAEIFTERLSNGTREFFLRIHEILVREGFIVQHGDNRITYFPDTNRQQPLVLRYRLEKDGLTVELKLNFIDCYTDIIEKMPEHIKALFRSYDAATAVRKRATVRGLTGRPYGLTAVPTAAYGGHTRWMASITIYAVISIIFIPMFPIPTMSITTQESFWRKRRQKRKKKRGMV